MEKPPKELSPISQIVRQRDGSLIALRRFFRSEAQNVLGRSTEATNYYIEFTANGLTDTAYYIMFETPSEKWKEDAEIAKIMIENRALNKEI